MDGMPKGSSSGVGCAALSFRLDEINTRIKEQMENAERVLVDIMNVIFCLNLSDHLYKSLSLLVSAILSQEFVHYSTLLKLAEKITQEENHRQIEELIQSGDYLTAAQRLEDWPVSG